MAVNNEEQSLKRARQLSQADADFAAWAEGCGVINHHPATQIQVAALLETLEANGVERKLALECLQAADRLANMGMWLVVHMTYARRAKLDGSPLDVADFKAKPEGHTGGALNMVPAYVGYLLANSLSGHTRSWMMGQGHCVAAIDAMNLLVGNMQAAHEQRYALTETGLETFFSDFYRCAVGADGRPLSPLGSHVNAYTAGGVSEGGYLGFAELQYVHMPLPGQSLVAFLSDGAFEEQRGSDWVPRWWRAEDCGTVVPVMIANGRRIDQRTTLAQTGGIEGFRKHLQLCGFDPLVIDGRDPAAFAAAILWSEAELAKLSIEVREQRRQYPVPVPYVIAETIKGFGFPGAGSNRAHNLPLEGNPAEDETARHEFNKGVSALFVAEGELRESVMQLNSHQRQQRPRERDHALAMPRPPLPLQPALLAPAPGSSQSPMAAIDDAFVALLQANPELRVRVGNPDEMRSNRLNRSLDTLKHRVTAPEQGIAESLHGAVITALNEEAVISAALANKQGINLVASYEAFAVKMLGAMRQEIIFARHQREIGREAGWLSVPVLLSSHTWENGKNEQSHQDPTLCEAWLGEMSDVAPVLFPPDASSAQKALLALYKSRGRIAAMVVPKNVLPVQFSGVQAQELCETGVLCLYGDARAAVQLFAVGAYQWIETLRAAERLQQADVPHALFVIQEPGRFRIPRDSGEAAVVHSPEHVAELIPEVQRRVFLAHCRPEVLAGVLRPLDTGVRHSRFLGYRNRGGTLDVFGMHYANRATWAHVLQAVADVGAASLDRLLGPEEVRAVYGEGNPEVLR